MTITARNYAAQAERGLHQWATAVSGQYPEDAGMVTQAAIEIGKAVHFALPDDGEIFADELRGIRGEEIRLPFPSITVEYFATGKRVEADQIHSPKRVILATEVHKNSIKNSLNDADRALCDIWIAIFNCCSINGEWVPVATGWLLPSKWDAEYGTKTINLGRADGKGAGITGHPITVLPRLSTMMLDSGANPAGMINDIVMEVRATLELLEALSCSNVSTEPIEKVDQAKNARRVRDGKLPIYETHTLVIDAGKGCGGASQGGSHASPRQHLRRGHIRRLQDGRRIWVNSCVVGSANDGKIDKTYDIRRAARASATPPTSSATAAETGLTASHRTVSPGWRGQPSKKRKGKDGRGT